MIGGRFELKKKESFDLVVVRFAMPESWWVDGAPRGWAASAVVPADAPTLRFTAAPHAESADQMCHSSGHRALSFS